MRSLIIIEVEHGETTDALEDMAQAAMQAMSRSAHYDGASVIDWTVRVDLPSCFVLDSSHTN